MEERPTPKRSTPIFLIATVLLPLLLVAGLSLLPLWDCASCKRLMTGTMTCSREGPCPQCQDSGKQNLLGRMTDAWELQAIRRRASRK